MARSSEAIVMDIIGDILGRKGLPTLRLGSDTPLDGSLGLDSLDFAEIVVRLEETTGQDPFATGVQDSVRTIGELAALYQV